MTIEKAITLLNKSTNKKAKLFVQISAFKTLEIHSVNYFLDGSIVISVKEAK